MKKWNVFLRNLFIVFLTFVITVSAAAYVIVGYLAEQEQTQKEKAYYLSQTIGSSLSQTLDACSFTLETWELLIVRENGDIQDFQDTTRQLFNNSGSIDRIELAPGGIITDAYPSKKDGDVGVNILKDARLKRLANYAKDNDATVISSPMQIDSSTFGIVMADPIYRDNVSGSRKFWGFSIMVIKLPGIFNQSSLSRLREEGYQYQIYTKTLDDKKIVIAQSTGQILTDSVDFTFAVPGDFAWTLSIRPENGWVNTTQRQRLAFGAMGMGALLGAIVWLLLLLRIKEKEFREMSFHDPLTGLFNQRSFVLKVEELLKKEKVFGVIYLDLNGFKQINDAYGHQAGDALLQIVAGRLEKGIHPADTAYRMGGDEFVVLVPGIHETDYYEEMLSELFAAIADTIEIKEQEIHIHASAGFARYPDDGADIDEIIRKSDNAMYADKRRQKEQHDGGYNEEERPQDMDDKTE